MSNLGGFLQGAPDFNREYLPMARNPMLLGSCLVVDLQLTVFPHPIHRKFMPLQ